MKNHTAAILSVVLSLCLCGCGTGKTAAVTDSGSAAKQEDGSEGKDGTLRISSVETYNRTEKIQKEDFYQVSNGKSSVSYTVEYSYDDAGHLISVKKNGGGIGNNAPMETYLYSGDLCTQKVLYDKNGSTEKAWYWTYDKEGHLTKERIVTIGASSGKTGRTEEVTEYDKNGLATTMTRTSPDGWEKDEYGYGPSGKLVTDNYYYSTDGKTYRFYETRTYQYDENGNLISLQKRDSGDTVYFSERYEYDDKGNIRKDTVYSAAEPTEKNMVSQRLYEYGDNGKVSFEAYYCGENQLQTYYEYDASGNCTVVSEQQYEDGKAAGTTVTATEYDEHFNPVRESEKGPDGTEKIHFIREYEYYDDAKIKKVTNYSTEE